MGGAVICALCVVLVCILRTQNAAVAAPVPAPGPARAPYELCTYFVKHEHRHHDSTTTPAPEEKPKDEKKEKMQLFSNLLRDLLDLEKEADKKKEEEAKKKKEEEEKKKKEEESKKADKDEPRGFKSFGELWDVYWKMMSTIMYSF